MNFNHIDQRCNLSGRSELGQDSHSYNSAFAFDLGYFMDFGWTASGFQMPNPYLESSNSTVSSSAMFSSIDDQGLFELAYEQSWKGTSTASNGWPSICCRNKGIVSNVDISGTWENPQAVSTAPLSTSFIHDQYYEGDEEEEQEAPKPFGFVTAEEHPQANYSQRESNTAEESPSSVGGFSKSSQTSSPFQEPTSTNHHLRSTKRTKFSTPRRPPLENSKRKKQSTHNEIEKQYRNRLNGQFEILLKTLPKSLIDGGLNRDRDGPEKKVSKAKVLTLAKKHIRELEEANEVLKGEIVEMEEGMRTLEKQWAELGGSVTP